MGVTRDFVAATVADALIPSFRRPVEDIIYETLDQRQIPNRTDFKEIRDLVNSIRGQVSGTANGIQKLAESREANTDQVATLQGRIDAMDARLAKLEQLVSSLQTQPSTPSVVPVSAAPQSCKVPGCDEKARARGFCARHYQKWRRGTLAGFPYPG